MATEIKPGTDLTQLTPEEMSNWQKTVRKAGKVEENKQAWQDVSAYLARLQAIVFGYNIKKAISAIVGEKFELEETKPLSLRDELVKDNTPFPYGLLSREEKNAVGKEICGIASVTSGGVIISPWQCECLSDKKIEELIKTVKGMAGATAGGVLFNQDLWE